MLGWLGYVQSLGENRHIRPDVVPPTWLQCWASLAGVSRLCAGICWKVTAADALRILSENCWEEKNRSHYMKVWRDCTQREQVTGNQGLGCRRTKYLDCFLNGNTSSQTLPRQKRKKKGQGGESDLLLVTKNFTITSNFRRHLCFFGQKKSGCWINYKLLNFLWFQTNTLSSFSAPKGFLLL